MTGRDDSVGGSSHNAEVPENDLVFPCSECGTTATRVRLMEPGQVPEAQDAFGADITRDECKIVLEIDGHGGRSDTIRADEVFQNWIDFDVHAIRSNESMALINWCYTCEKWYCAAHLRSRRVVYGAPMYDYYYEVVCPEGHSRNVDRI